MCTQRTYTRIVIFNFVLYISLIESSSLVITKTSCTLSTLNKEVTLDLLKASTVNITASYNWIFHSHHKFFIEFGYAFAMQTNSFVVKDGSVLTDVGVKTLRLVQPGGLITGIGVMFGL